MLRGDHQAEREGQMDKDGGDTTASADALAGMSEPGDVPEPETEGFRWLGIGVRLGLERPDAARRLLGLIEARDPDVVEASSADPIAPDPAVPVLSALLARSAGLPPGEMATLGPDVVFGWASELTSAQVLRVGRVLMDMLAAGAPADAARGFGLAWDGGAKIPRHERDTMFSEFTDLELTVASVFAGRDLRPLAPAPKPRLGVLAVMLGNRNAGQSAAAAALDGAGEPARRALVALWNAWVAMRYRTVVPAATFELLTRPWVTVVGALPEPG
jgi:hypothetical protein